MGIANRDKDTSEQLYVVSDVKPLVATSVVSIIGAVPSPGQIAEFKLTAKGISGLPAYQLGVQRWTSAGITTIPVAAAIAFASNFGVSGGMIGQTYAMNSSLAAVQAGDLLVATSSVANTASLELVLAVVVKATQDIKKSFDI